MKKKVININLTKLIILIILLIVWISSIIKIIKWNKDNKDNEFIRNEIQQIIIKTNENQGDTNTTNNNLSDSSGLYSVDFNSLKKINPDAVAYLEVNGTNITYPVVKSTDNSYYLLHNFNKEYNSSGWIFADYRNKFDGTDKNLIIYGHNVKDNSMFGSLKNILTKEWYDNEKNYNIKLATEGKNEAYRVFSVYQIEEEDYYIQTKFKNSESFSSFIKTLQKRSIKNFNEQISAEDNILTLSTCANNNKYRIVLHAKKVN